MELKAADVMTRNVVCVSITTTVQELVELFFAKKVGGVPVINEEKKVVGIISKTDLVTHGLERELSSILSSKKEGELLTDFPDFDNLLGPEPSKETVDQIMTAPVITAKPSTSVKEIVKIMLNNKIHRVVITENEVVVGIVTTMDLLSLLNK